MHSADTNALQSRFDERVLAWRVIVDEVDRTAHSMVAYGRRDQQPIVLKVVRPCSGESCSGEVLEAFGARGMVRVLEHAEGSVLLERLSPGTSIVEEDIGDDEATAILADVIRGMSPNRPPRTVPTVLTWGEAFERYAESGSSPIALSLVETAQRTYLHLCATQTTTRLLHGDLHHHNVLRDSRHGWVAIDPKGVVGELAYEVGAALRNPCERPELFADPGTIRKRVNHFARMLGLDTGRILAWAFSQAVLAAIWELEDDGVLDAGLGWIALATVIRSMPEADLDH